MSEIDNFAANIATDIKDESENFNSLMITLMIVSIIISALRLMVDCKLFGKNMESRIKNHLIFYKILIKKEIIYKLPNEYSNLKDQIFDQIVSKSPNLTSNQIQKMLEEAKNAG